MESQPRAYHGCSTSSNVGFLLQALNNLPTCRGKMHTARVILTQHAKKYKTVQSSSGRNVVKHQVDTSLACSLTECIVELSFLPHLPTSGRRTFASIQKSWLAVKSTREKDDCALPRDRNEDNHRRRKRTNNCDKLPCVDIPPV